MFSPEGGAAAGAVLGLMVANIAGFALSRNLFAKPPEAVQVTAEKATEEGFGKLVLKEKGELDEAHKAYYRKVQAVSGVVSVIGAAVGAAVGSDPNRAAGAAAGAAIGAGAIQIINVLAARPAGLPAFIAGGVGAYMGARSA